MPSTPTRTTMLRLREVKIRTGLGGSTIYRLAQERKFPQPVKIGERASAWIETEVEQWLAEHIEATRASKAPRA